MTDNVVEPVTKPVLRVGVPPPDSPGGLALLGALILGTAYVLLLVGAYSALEAQVLWFVPLTLLLAVVASFFLVSMIGSDRARATDFELEFARTVQAHLAAGETLVEASPLGGILSEYASAADEQRRSAREHTYAAGPAVYGTGFALLSTLFFGLAFVTGTPAGLLVIGFLAELGALILLAFAAGLLVLSVGRSKEVREFDALVLRRWSQVARPSFPFSHSLSDVPWASPDPRRPPAPP
jgi:hypothetical protein